MNEPTRLVVVRHGETAWNAGTRMQGQLDTELNDKGRWQAEQLVPALDGEAIELIVSSDLQRALQTAAPLARALRCEVTPDRGLRERSFGIFEGHTYADIERLWSDGWASWHAREPGYAPEGGETLQAFHDRCIATAQRLCEQHAGRTMAWFTHGGVLDCLYRAAARVDLRSPRSWLLANASINRMLYSDQGLMLVGWGDVRHLEQPTLDDAER